jgi:glycosyltransferase involved in cell wall biosynthesis
MKRFIKNMSENKILFLWTYRGLISNLAKTNIINPKTKEDDLYITLAKGLIKNKIVSGADLIWIDKNLKEEMFTISKNINIYIFKSVASAKKSFKNKKYKLLFVRSNISEFSDLSKPITAEKKIFYSADSEYYPTYWKQNYFDLIFVDEKSQIPLGKKKHPKTKFSILNKPVNTKIFKPLKTKKIYDICYIGNFVPWKKHDLLFSALDKIPGSNKIKLVCVGKTFGRDSEISIAAWKYHVNLELKGGLSKKEVVKIINQSKFGIIVSEKDANPRTITEQLACNIPLVVNSDLVGGKRLINKQTGIISKPEDLPKKIIWMLNNYKKFNPLKYHNKHLLLDNVIKNNFINNLK